MVPSLLPSERPHGILQGGRSSVPGIPSSDRLQAQVENTFTLRITYCRDMARDQSCLGDAGARGGRPRGQSERVRAR